MHHHQLFMQRCIQLAYLGEGYVLPNPMVGAVLVYNGQIIGEGYHQQYGGPHAEVNCIRSVAHADKQYIKDATLYVSLEPCSHHGKTPPCTDLILQHQIKKLVIGAKDANPKVNGLELLGASGVEITEGIMQTECLQQNEVFFFNQLQQKSFFTAKYACSTDGFLNDSSNTRTIISNELTQRYVHQLRAQYAAILIGSSTYLKDKPQLSNRYFGKKQPIKIVIDRKLSIDWQQELDGKTDQWIIVNCIKENVQENIHFLKINDGSLFFDTLQRVLLKMSIANVLVEGGGKLLTAMFSVGCINKLVKITNQQLLLSDGVIAPVIPTQLTLASSFYLKNDSVQIFQFGTK